MMGTLYLLLFFVALFCLYRIHASWNRRQEESIARAQAFADLIEIRERLKEPYRPPQPRDTVM